LLLGTIDVKEEIHPMGINVPQTPISYLTIVSIFLHHYKDIYSPDRIFNWINPNCLINISETPFIQVMDSMTPLPPGFIQTMYRFIEPEGRPGEIEVVFRNDMLINFRSQLVFLGLFRNLRAQYYLKSRLKPFLYDLLGSDQYQYDDMASSYLNKKVLTNYIVAYRKVLKFGSVSVWLTHKDYMYNLD